MARNTWREIVFALSIDSSIEESVNDIRNKYCAGHSTENCTQNVQKRQKELIKSRANPKVTPVDIINELKEQNIANVTRFTVTRRLRSL